MPPAAENVQQPNAQHQQGGFGGNLIGTIFRMIFFWWLMNYLKSGGKGASQQTYINFFQRGEPVDIKIFIDVSPALTSDLIDREPDWEISGIKLAAEEETLAKNLTYNLPDSAQNNGTVYLHTIVLREGYDFEKQNAFFGRVQLTRYGPKRKEKVQKNLLFEEDGKEVKEQAEVKEEEEALPDEIVNYWKPSITVAMVDDFSKYSLSKVPPVLRPYFKHDEQAGYYYPMIFFNEFWLLKSHMIEINETVTSVPLELTLSSIRPWLVQIIVQMEEAFKTQASMGLNSDEETDEFKKILVEGNPVLLGVTFVVSILHSVFDFLAFKNDIGFWKNNQSMEGLSARSIIINAACQLIIFLYLLDNETSFVVLLSSGVGVLIEFWKITKAMNVTINWTHGFPLLHIADRDSYEQSRTREHDEKAMKYLSYALYPLVVGYSIYALIHQSHKSWYSWILSSLVGAVYAFGFILMCPQLYLNYKLKSVAHLPWRQLTYKFLNTIIDDLFAFVITMPWLHRLSVFRDDLVFMIYLYQWYIYGVDKSRVNEFGFSETTTEPTESAEALPEAEVKEPEVDAEKEKEEDNNSKDTVHNTGLRQRKPTEDEDVGVVEEIDEAEVTDATKKDN